jgi:hypothetical protein
VELLASAGTGNSITSDAIYSNGGIGIDLGNDGVTLSDPGDTDAGPNSLLNFPVMTAVLESGGILTVSFRLDVPAASYRIEFFKNPSGADPSGNGEGEVFAGSINIIHPGGGPFNFNHGFPGAAGDIITATTTLCTDGCRLHSLWRHVGIRQCGCGSSPPGCELSLDRHGRRRHDRDPSGHQRLYGPDRRRHFLEG